MNVLVVDIGGTNVKILATGQKEPREVSLGADADARADGGRSQGAGRRTGSMTWYRSATPGGSCHDGGHGTPQPRHGWVGFDFAAAFGRPVKVINDAAMQALGSYNGGTMLFLGLGTGLGSALMVEGTSCRWNWATCLTRRATYEDYVGSFAD